LIKEKRKEKKGKKNRKKKYYPTLLMLDETPKSGVGGRAQRRNSAGVLL